MRWSFRDVVYIDPVKGTRVHMHARVRMHDRGLVTNALALIVCGLLAGLVVAAAAFPAAAIAGLAAKTGADQLDDIPGLFTARPPQITNVYASDGKTLITSLYDENRRDVSVGQIAPVMLNAVVASEDKRYFDHHGVDFKGVIRAFVADQQNQDQQGASTLTMQYVRLDLSYSATTPQQVIDATADTVSRKLREMRYAIGLEKQEVAKFNGDEHTAKLDILDKYLNIAPFGHGAYGIYAASELYFSEPPSELTLPQAALIAGLLQGTTEFDPTTPQGLANAIARRNTHVLPEMLSMGYITQQQMQAAMAPIKLKQPKEQYNGCTATTDPSYGYFCDYLVRWWESQPAFGANSYDRQEALETGGYNIVTSLNAPAQNAADKIISQYDPIGHSDASMVAAVEPGTGHIQVMAVNRVYSNDESHNGPMTDPVQRAAGIEVGSYPNNTLPLFSNAGYQWGSTFKMFTMVGALEQGVPLDYQINAPVVYTSNFINNGDNGCNGLYCVRNAVDSESGSYTMWTAFGRSVNTYFVPLEARVGLGAVVDAATQLGLANVAQFAPQNGDLGSGSFTLGTPLESPVTMAAAYAAIADNGIYCLPTPVVSITDFDGNRLDVANPQCHQAVPADVANAAADAARCPLGGQSATGNQCNFNTSTGRGIAQAVGRPVIGKTGTTDNAAAASLIAATPQLAVAGVITDPDYPAPTDPSFHGRDHHAINVEVWTTLKAAMKGLPVDDFAPPPDNLVHGTGRVGIPKVTCESVDTAIQALTAKGFKISASGVLKAPVPSNCGAGKVARTDPSGSTDAGVPIEIYVSSGVAPKPPPGPGGPPTGGPTGGPTPGPTPPTGGCVLPIPCPPPPPGIP